MSYLGKLLEGNSQYVHLRSMYHYYKKYVQWRFDGCPVPPAIVKHWAIKHYASKYRIKTFVETGTYMGNTIQAVSRNFRRLYSIELSEELYQNARFKFANQPHISLYQGDSSVVLPQIIENIEEPVLFYLDAHYSGGITSCGDKDTPILTELTNILNHPLKHQHIILIDDARCFNGSNDYPDLSDLQQFILGSKVYQSCYVLNDIIRIHND
ncbi:hypothetical protein SR1949_51370 [Sphaerospermopsis reniformis]|uniref:Class I SAM-dependent methyltransferase n=1 Tax=Sphaerospermopsis reniformis TaxID=531300 RepID=A0A480A4U5_9CYAN|nr:class I SAM-dependent methyltransferase [Sphaerospermopsis reniformis]GCL40005.1 hypothetical protein SR1949_51370 [Sphaerospermopsis reniformis]